VPNPLPAAFRGPTTETGNYKTTEETYLYSARFDHQFSIDHNFFARLSVSPSDLTGLQSNSQNQVTPSAVQKLDVIEIIGREEALPSA